MGGHQTLLGNGWGLENNIEMDKINVSSSNNLLKAMWHQTLFFNMLDYCMLKWNMWNKHYFHDMFFKGSNRRTECSFLLGYVNLAANDCYDASNNNWKKKKKNNKIKWIPWLQIKLGMGNKENGFFM